MQTLINSLQEWAVVHGLKIILIIIAAALLSMILNASVRRFENRFVCDTMSEKGKRVKTLSSIIKTTVIITISTAAILMIIAECGIAIGPLLAGAGIVGIAVGFGAQTLVKDIISGFFIIIEDQIRIGDVVNVAGVAGIVEAINLRTIRLRDVEARVHIVPNGLIEVATNFTREFSRALVEISIAYKEDVDQVIDVLREVGEELCADPAFKNVILEPMTVQGLNSLGESSVNIGVFFKTLPIHQWDVAREFRKRVKRTFDQRGISIPFPHRTIYMASNTAGASSIDNAPTSDPRT